MYFLNISVWYNFGVFLTEFMSTNTGIKILVIFKGYLWFLKHYKALTTSAFKVDGFV